MTVNGAAYTASALHQAIVEAAFTKNAIRLMVRQEGETFAAQISYYDGERYPRLKHHAGGPALLDAILKPRRSN